MPVVSNTSPILNLAIIGQLDLLRMQFSRIIIPPADLAELRFDTSLPGAHVVRQAILDHWIEVQEIQDSTKARQMFLFTKNRKLQNRSGDWFEALVSAAIILASRRGGFGGISVPRFVEEVALELEAGKELDETDFLKKAPFLRNMRIPYMSPPNVEWPTFLHKVDGAFFADYKRTVHSENMNGRCQTEHVTVTTEEKHV